MDDLALSVVIPTYGRSADLVGLLRSVHPNSATHEVLVIDDASDNPEQFDPLKSEFPKVRFVRLKNNSGPGVARNFGAKEAKGEVVLYLDSDTELEPGGIERVIEFFDEEPEVNMCCGWDSETPLNSGFFPRFKALFMVIGAPEADANVSFLPGRCFAVRRRIMLESGGFDPIYKGADVEDFELGYRLQRNYGVIRYLSAFRVRHRYPSLMNQFQLYFKRVRMWIELRTMAGEFEDSFGTSRSDAIVQLASVTWPFVLLTAMVVGYPVVGIAALGGAIYLNRKFLGLCLAAEGPLFTGLAVLCHSFLAVAVFAGAVDVVARRPSLLFKYIG